MIKPDKNQLDAALAEAQNMRLRNDDPHHLAQVLLYLHEKTLLLDRLFHSADSLVHHGNFPHQHAELAHMVDQIKKLERIERHADDP